MRNGYLLLVLLLLSPLVGCGGGGAQQVINDPPSAPAINQPYSGTATDQNGVRYDIVGSVQTGAAQNVFDVGGIFYALPAVSASGAFSGPVTLIEPAGESFRGPAPTVTFDGTATASSFSGSGTESGVGNFTANGAAMPIQVPTLASLAGFYGGYQEGIFGMEPQVTISTAGQISGNDAWGCQLSGELSVGSSGMLSVALTSTGSNSACIGSASGPGWLSTSDAFGIGANNGEPGAYNLPGPYLYLSGYNSGNGLLLELAKQ